jgi:hypothetical protein
MFHEMKSMINRARPTMLEDIAGVAFLFGLLFAALSIS